MEKIKEFYKLADSYCRYISLNVISMANILVLMELLMKLYISAGNLPETEPETIDSAMSVETNAIQITFNHQIPQLYWKAFDPFVCEDTVCANLTEDLSEIAKDLKTGMKEFEEGRTGNAVFEWRLGFESHWGSHLVDALRALHRIRTH